MFRWLESRLLWGALLILAGAVFLLQNLGILEIGNLFWAFLFVMGGLIFLSVFLSDRAHWWALIPGFTLLSIGTLIALTRFAPRVADVWGGSMVLGGIGLSFILIYLVDRSNWWAIIPGGVMLTLTFIAGLDQALGGFGLGGLLFLGIGLTFALVAVLPNPHGDMRWAWIPAGILLVMGLLITAAAEEWIRFLWPVALIIIGLVLLSRVFIRR